MASSSPAWSARYWPSWRRPEQPASRSSHFRRGGLETIDDRRSTMACGPSSSIVHRPSSSLLVGETLETIRSRMNRTGIGLAGIDGVWWLPATQPIVLPGQLAHDLAQIGRAIFALFDSVTTIYGTPAGDTCGLNWLLSTRCRRPFHGLWGRVGCSASG